MFTLKNFLLCHHGQINRILLSYPKTDSPVSLGKEYEEWFKETNKSFNVNINLQHNSKKLEEYKQLLPYLNLKVTCWDIFEKDNEKILEVSLK